MLKLQNLKAALGFLPMLAMGFNVQAANYFNWGVEDLRPSWGVNGTSTYNVQWKSNSS